MILRPLQALFYKEWIKLRTVWLLLLAAHLLLAGFLIFRLATAMRLDDPTVIWSGWIFNGHVYFQRYMYAPLLTGVLLAMAQFLPEERDRRIRLVFHLPLGEEWAMAGHLLAGVLLLAGIFTSTVALLLAGAWRYFPPDYLATATSTLGPWLLAGVAGYALIAAALLEGHWRHRVFHLLLGLAVVRVYYLGELYGVYRNLWWILGPGTFLLLTLPLLAAYRFRKGLAV